jgi:hypothetical protein
MLQRIASYIMPSDSNKLTFDVEDVISKLTTDEKIALLSGMTAVSLLYQTRPYRSTQESTSGIPHRYRV